MPHSVGMVWSYCRTIREISDNYNFRGFFFLRSDIEKVLQDIRRPDVFGFSCYVWNWEYNKVFARKLKELHPDCLIVFGGPQVPNRSNDFFDENYYVDILVHGEGEYSFADILRERIRDVPDYKTIPGLTVNSGNGIAVKTHKRERVNDLDSIPSPLLSGVFDELLALPYDFHASQETHRGCPYSCAFCDWGSSVFTKVRRFSKERIAEEIDWIGRNKIELLYNCDANFGIFKEDESIAERIAKSKQKYGYPKKFRAAYAKNSNERVYRISSILNKHEMSKGVTLSLQSLNAKTLDDIKRSNIKLPDFGNWIAKYHKGGMPTYTELILGLPGESYDTFVDGIETLLDVGQHEGIFIFPCMVLPNSELGDIEYIKQYGIKSCQVNIPPFHATPSADDVPEYQSIVIETNTMSVKDWRKVYTYAWALQSFHGLGLLRDIAICLKQLFGLKYQDFYEQLTNFAVEHPDTMIGGEFSIFSDYLDRFLDGQIEACVLPKYGDITWPPEEATFLRVVDKKEKFYEEIVNFVKSCSSITDNTTPAEFFESLVVYQKNMILDPSTPERFEFAIMFDIQSLLSEKPEMEKLEIGSLKYKVNARKNFKNDAVQYAREVVWYGRKGGNFKHKTVRISRV